MVEECKRRHITGAEERVWFKKEGNGQFTPRDARERLNNGQLNDGHWI